MKRNEGPKAPMRTWLAEPMPREVKEAVEGLRSLDDVQRIAVMPDVHLGESVCVGVVMATTHLVYPAAVGGDIGCGIATVRLRGEAASLEELALKREVLRRLHAAVPIMRQRSMESAPELTGELHPEVISSPALAAVARRMGRIELGTLGRGNHFLEVQSDADGCAWLMVHTGSRAVGQAVMRTHLEMPAGTSRGLRFLDAGAANGRAYLDDAAWACRYAAANRAAILRSAGLVTSELLGLSPDFDSLIECNHNHVREEVHNGAMMLVHRKGASPAGEGERGLIPGAMGRESFHVTGRGEPESLRSSSHGAGRALSRGAARKAISVRRLAEDAGGVVFDSRLGDHLREEAASAYKDIRAVMRAQRDLVRADRVVEGILCYKGV